MFKGTFYDTIGVEAKEDSALFTIRLNPDHPVYCGHFPGNPIVPGVCSLQIIKECVEYLQDGHKMTYSKIDQCKYLNAINPHTNAFLSISLKIRKNDEEGIGISATIFHEETTFVSLQSLLIIK